MPKQVCDRIMWSEIFVIHHGADIIEDESTWKTIDVDEYTEKYQSELMPPMYHDLSQLAQL